MPSKERLIVSRLVLQNKEQLNRAKLPVERLKIWETIKSEAISQGADLGNKTAKDIRDTLWAAIKRDVHEKLDKKGKNVVLNEIDKIVLEFEGKDSPAIKQLDVADSEEKPKPWEIGHGEDNDDPPKKPEDIFGKDSDIEELEDKPNTSKKAHKTGARHYGLFGPTFQLTPLKATKISVLEKQKLLLSQERHTKMAEQEAHTEAAATHRAQRRLFEMELKEKFGEEKFEEEEK